MNIGHKIIIMLGALKYWGQTRINRGKYWGQEVLGSDSN